MSSGRPSYVTPMSPISPTKSTSNLPDSPYRKVIPLIPEEPPALQHFADLSDAESVKAIEEAMKGRLRDSSGDVLMR